MTASVLATYKSLPTSAMPKGECNCASNTVRWSATPSPSVSRSRVMRSALGPLAPDLLIISPMNQARRLGLASGLAGALVSATSTSPFGSTYNQRGWSSPLANACTCRPAAGTGARPSLQPWAGAILTVGTKVGTGSGKTGLGPVPANTGNVATSPHAHKPQAKPIATR